MPYASSLYMRFSYSSSGPHPACELNLRSLWRYVRDLRLSACAHRWRSRCNYATQDAWPEDSHGLRCKTNFVQFPDYAAAAESLYRPALLCAACLPSKLSRRHQSACSATSSGRLTIAPPATVCAARQIRPVPAHSMVRAAHQSLAFRPAPNSSRLSVLGRFGLFRRYRRHAQWHGRIGRSQLYRYVCLRWHQFRLLLRVRRRYEPDYR